MAARRARARRKERPLASVSYRRFGWPDAKAVSYLWHQYDPKHAPSEDTIVRTPFASNIYILDVDRVVKGFMIVLDSGLDYGMVDLLYVLPEATGETWGFVLWCLEDMKKRFSRIYMHDDMRHETWTKLLRREGSFMGHQGLYVKELA